MKWCERHWDGLRAEIDRQGLGSLVPDTAEKAARAFERRAAGDESMDAFDPLMGAMWAINQFIGSQFGPDGLMAVMSIDGCPICEADEIHQAICEVNGPGCTESYARFFPDAVGDQRKAWEELRR